MSVTVYKQRFKQVTVPETKGIIGVNIQQFDRVSDLSTKLKFDCSSLTELCFITLYFTTAALHLKHVSRPEAHFLIRTL